MLSIQLKCQWEKICKGALNLAIKTKDPDMIHDMAVRLAKGGIPMRYFRRFKAHKWFPDFEKRFSIYDSIYKNTYNLGYKERLIHLMSYDSDFNKRYHQWRSGKIDMTLKEMIFEAQYISKEFESLINEFGLPIEKEIGYFYDRKYKKVTNFPVAALIIHIHQLGKLVINPDQIYSLVCHGTLNSEYKDIIPKVRGFGGGNVSIEEEMTIRYSKYKGGNKQR